jgi:hypothetical protein
MPDPLTDNLTLPGVTTLPISSKSPRQRISVAWFAEFERWERAR